MNRVARTLKYREKKDNAYSEKLKEKKELLEILSSFKKYFLKLCLKVLRL